MKTIGDAIWLRTEIYSWFQVTGSLIQTLGSPRMRQVHGLLTDAAKYIIVSILRSLSRTSGKLLM